MVKPLTDGLAPLIYPPNPFRLARPARPLESYIVPKKVDIFASTRQLVAFSMGLAEDNRLTPRRDVTRPPSEAATHPLSLW